MRTYLLIGLGGILGANARYLVSVWAAGRWPAAFPYGTLIVNITGSLLLGVTLALLGTRPGGSADARLLVGTGFCGAYTTFSTFAFESVALMRERDHLPALANVLGNVLLCLVGTAAGILLATALGWRA